MRSGAGKQLETRSDNMACRIGMTTNPAERERYWRSRVTGFRNWQILASGVDILSSAGPRSRGSQERRMRAWPWRCIQARPVWSVYKFKYTSDTG